ncbi:hypothetical protein ACXO71_05370 [Lactobacillus delbrueckii subsp. bulgaricus]
MTGRSHRLPGTPQGVVYQIFPDCFNNGNPHGEIQGRKKDSLLRMSMAI